MSITFEVEGEAVVIQYDDEKIDGIVKPIVVRISRSDLYKNTIASFSTWRADLLMRHLQFLEGEIDKLKHLELGEAKTMIDAIKYILAQRKK